MALRSLTAADKKVESNESPFPPVTIIVAHR